MDMKQWGGSLLNADVKKPMPILSFPSVQLLNINVEELIRSSDKLSEGMKLIAQRTDAAASLSMMDLSVEAEAFGSKVRFSSDEVPTVIDRIVLSKEDAEALVVPGTDSGRIAIYIDAIAKAKRLVTDRPVFAGIIGSLSLAGRLIGVSEAMLAFYEEPEMVHEALEKSTQFLIKYALAYKATGADGIVIAEPLAGLLSPDLCEEFSTPYVKRISDAVKSDDFAVVYHNCGNSAVRLIDSILKIGANAYHFGNAISMEDVLAKFPADTIALGNIDPASQFRNGTPESIREATLELLSKCGSHKNFVISSGCDIPPASSWANIDAFFAAVKEYYSSHK
jgi:uroporphyrinogen decarboxylase